MKYILLVILLGIVSAIGFKMYILNKRSADQNGEGSFISYNWNFQRESANKIVQNWIEHDLQKNAVRKLLFYDFLFIIMYSIFFCAACYNLLQNQNRYWLNSWLRLGIFSIILGAVLNMVQDYFLYATIDWGRVFFPASWIAIVKWFFVTLAVLPVILTVCLKPVRAYPANSSTVS